jgi:PAS domain-containing protein
MADALLVTDTDGVITRVNPALSVMFDLKESDINGMRCEALFGADLARLAEKSKKFSGDILTSEIGLAGGRVGKAVATGIHKDILDTDATVGKGIGSVILIRDITTE